MKNTVIFDLDGLLIDSEFISYQINHDLTVKYGKDISMEDYIHKYSGKTADRNMKTLIDEYHLPLSVRDGLSFVALKEKEYFKQGVALKQGAEELLTYLRKNQYKLVLASSSTKERAINVLEQNGIAAFFDHMVFGTEVKRGKPYPDIFVKACVCAGEPIENCLVLEDSEAGIQAAFSAGIEVICIPDMKVPGEDFYKMAAAVLSSLKDVISWLENERTGLEENLKWHTVISSRHSS